MLLDFEPQYFEASPLKDLELGLYAMDPETPIRQAEAAPYMDLKWQIPETVGLTCINRSTKPEIRKMRKELMVRAHRRLSLADWAHNPNKILSKHADDGPGWELHE